MSPPQLPPTERYSPRFVRWFVRLTHPLFQAWFRPRIEGLQKVPDGPCLVAGNHSAFGVMEILMLLCAWHRAHQGTRPVVGLSHDLGLSWPLRWGVERIGGVRASRRRAVEALQRQLPVLVFPGGDLDLFRSFCERDQVLWGRRAGFVETALQTGAPIVPMAICGSHAQYLLLPGGERFARLLGLARWRIHRWSMPASFPLVLGAAVAALAGVLSPVWVAATLLWMVVPLPTRIDVSFLDPLDARALVRETGSVQAAAEEIRRRIEARVGELSARRRTPWF